MCAPLSSLARKLDALWCDGSEVGACPLATLSLELFRKNDVTYMKTCVDVGQQTHLVRRPVVLERHVQNVVLEIPSGMLLCVVGGASADETEVQRADGRVLTSMGETLEYVVTMGEDADKFSVCFDVGPPHEQEVCGDELRGCALDAQRLVAALHLNTAVKGGERVASLQAMEHHLSQLDAMLLKLDRLAQGVLAGVEATADSACLRAFGGSANYIVSECRVPPDTPLLPLVQAQLARVQAGLDSVGGVRLDADGGALGVVSARHFAGEDLGLFSRSVDRLMRARESLAESLRFDKGRCEKRRPRMHTRLVYHELLTLDALLREHVLEVCGCASRDFELQQRTRLFEVLQLQASNEREADAIPSLLFADSRALMQSLPPPQHATGMPQYATAMTRGLLASALLRSLQRTRFPIATDNSFSYRHQSGQEDKEECGGSSDDFQFVLDKIRKDTQHEIIPPMLGAHIISLLMQRAKSTVQASDAERVIAIFCADLQPLLHSCLLDERADNAYSFLRDPTPRTGYAREATSELMLDIICA